LEGLLHALSKDHKLIDEEFVTCDVSLKELPTSEAIVPGVANYLMLTHSGGM